MSKLDIIVAVIFLIGLVLFLIDMFSHKNGEVKDTTKIDYDLWSIISSILLAIPLLAYEVFRFFFWPRRRRIK